MAAIVSWKYLVLLCWFTALGIGGESYRVVGSLRRTFDVRQVDKADVSLLIRSGTGEAIYRLQCHSAGYTGDPDFDYSGDFECRLSSVGDSDEYSTLLTEDPNQSRDWESRGRFFASELRGDCAAIPQFGASRDFRLRGMEVSLNIMDPKFTNDGGLSSLKLVVRVRPVPTPRSPIAEAVPVPRTGVAERCHLHEHFLDFSHSPSPSKPQP